MWGQACVVVVSFCQNFVFKNNFKQDDNGADLTPKSSLKRKPASIFQVS